MAVKMSMDASKFFQSAFDDGDAPLGMFNAMMGMGVACEIGFYSVTLSHSGKNLAVNLPVSTSTLLKGSAQAAAKSTCQKILAQVLSQAYTTWFSVDEQVGAALATPHTKKKAGPPSTVSAETLQSVADILGMDPAAKDSDTMGYAEQSPDGSFVVKKEPKTAPKTNALEVEKLRNATFLSQKVRGTSPGSIYRVVALSPRIKVAARIQQPSHLSIRAEGLANAYEQGKLKGLGFTLTGTVADGYWSMHLDCAGCTPARCLGAVLMDLGVDFNEQAKNLKEVSLEA